MTPAAIAFAGFLLASAAGSEPESFTVAVVRTDGLIELLYPLAAVNAGGRAFWIVQAHGWEDERSQVLEVGSPSMRLASEVESGGC